MYGNKGEVPEDEDFLIPLGVADIKREGTDCHDRGPVDDGPLALQAAERIQSEYGVSVEVVDPRTIKPLDIGTIIESVRKTNRALVVTSSLKQFGLGSEVAAEIQERAFFDLDQPVKRLSPPFTPAPFGRQFDEYLNPSADSIVSAVRELVA
jgi:pyruvate/2-oxoglutarate/acetoin dehydrogenase E1 component